MSSPVKPKPKARIKADRILGVDGNWYLHRVVHTQQFEPEDEAASQARRFLGMICKDAGAVRAKRIFVAFDGWAIFRYKLYKLYKGNRGNEGPSGVYDHLDFLKGYLFAAGIPFVHEKLYEADDWLCSLAATYEDVVIGCGDKDAWQYVRPGMCLYNSASKPEPTKIRCADVTDKIGLFAHQCVDYQTLIGDKIDNVPQLLGPAKAQAGLHQWGTINAWAAADPGFRKWARRNVEALSLNRKLVKLRPDLPVEVPPIKWTDDPKVTQGYRDYKAFAGSRSKGLF